MIIHFRRKVTQEPGFRPVTMNVNAIAYYTPVPKDGGEEKTLISLLSGWDVEVMENYEQVEARVKEALLEQRIRK